jgi:hypothetical protein
MTKLIRRLQAALGSHDLVQIIRTQPSWDRREGYVAAVGRMWLLIASLNSLLLREVNTQTEWSGSSKWAFGQLSRVDAGGGYESALAEIAGTPQPN